MMLSRRFFLLPLISIILLSALLLSHDSAKREWIPKAVKEWTPSLPKFYIPLPFQFGSSSSFASDTEVVLDLTHPYNASDSHPLSKLLATNSAKAFNYDSHRSTSFEAIVTKYRAQYGRDPPPNFDKWYSYAKSKGVVELDAFDRINDDIRPFWGLEPLEIRRLAAHAADKDDYGNAVLHVRNGKAGNISGPAWRITPLSKMVAKFAKDLPDMDIAMNYLDEPRLVVQYEEMQRLLKLEESRRVIISPDSMGEVGFTKGLWTKEKLTPTTAMETDADIDYAWFHHAGHQFMDVGRGACPPDSPANAHKDDPNIAESQWALSGNEGSFVTDFNKSTDLCTISPGVDTIHGYLFAAGMNYLSKKLMPIFSECKVSVNNDILIPASIYANDEDQRFIYDDNIDPVWKDKIDKIVWKGKSSGGAHNPDNFRRMHRVRLVDMLNPEPEHDRTVELLSNSSESETYTLTPSHATAPWLKTHANVSFTEVSQCTDNCSYFTALFPQTPGLPMSAQFSNKYLIDVDGNSFSGRWRAFLLSKSMPIKSTIFKEWHDQRLRPYVDFVPLSTSYKEIYGLLAYFMGWSEKGVETENGARRTTEIEIVKRHDVEAERVAETGREWARKVLRKEDMEVYIFRLLLEYGRVLDDNREKIGYVGTGVEVP